MAPKTREAPAALVVPRLELKTMTVRLVGDSPLICHAFSQKAKQQMLDKMQKKPKQAKEVRNPVADFWESLYVLRGAELVDRSTSDIPAGVVFGFPSIAFKSAAVDACSHVDGITKVEARGAFHINGEFVELEGMPILREDVARVGMGVADLRYRGEFRDWAVTFPLRYNPRVLSAEQIANLFNIAGFAIGVGDWRPQRDGQFGMFRYAGS